MSDREISCSIARVLRTDADVTHFFGRPDLNKKIVVVVATVVVAVVEAIRKF